MSDVVVCIFFFFQAEDGIRDVAVTGVQTCALPICLSWPTQFGLSPPTGSWIVAQTEPRRAGGQPSCRFLLAFEARLAYLEEIPATEVSDGSTCTQGTIPGNRLDPVDTLTWPSGPLWKDCETFDKALDLAASNDELYLRIYIYNDNGEILHEARSEEHTSELQSRLH